MTKKSLGMSLEGTRHTGRGWPPAGEAWEVEGRSRQLYIAVARLKVGEMT